jgi:hypothetical protein
MALGENEATAINDQGNTGSPEVHGNSIIFMVCFRGGSVDGLTDRERGKR